LLVEAMDEVIGYGTVIEVLFHLCFRFVNL
jgi:hypothetical protein